MSENHTNKKASVLKNTINSINDLRKTIRFILLVLFILLLFYGALQPVGKPSYKRIEPWLATGEQAKPEAAEIHDIILNFRPVAIGDPITGAEYRYVPESSCWTWGAVAAILGATAAFFFIRIKRRDAPMKRKIKSALCWIIIPAIVAFAFGYGASYYYGGPYNYQNYAAPTTAGDVLIWFSGSDDGAYFMDNYARSIREFGYDRAALFNFRDMKQALEFAEKLPDGCRIIVRGHSMGGAAAFHFAEQCRREILLLDTRDPTSWFNHPTSKPSNVVHWRNVLPGAVHPFVSESSHEDTNYFCGMNMSNVFRWLGRPWDVHNDAVNLYIIPFDHHDVGEKID